MEKNGYLQTVYRFDFLAGSGDSKSLPEPEELPVGALNDGGFFTWVCEPSLPLEFKMTPFASVDGNRE